MFGKLLCAAFLFSVLVLTSNLQVIWFEDTAVTFIFRLEGNAQYGIKHFMLTNTTHDICPSNICMNLYVYI